MEKSEWSPVTASFDRNHVVKVLKHFHRAGDLIEMRTFSHLFYTTEVEKAADWAGARDGRCDVWHLINALPPDYLEDRQRRINDPADSTKSTSAARNQDVVHRRCLLLDFDPVRDRDVASTDDELQAAEACATVVAQSLGEAGFPRPTRAMSGNGYHLTWRIDMAVTEANRPDIDKLIRDWVHAVSRRFSNPEVEIDNKVHNAGRLLNLRDTSD